MSEEKDKQFTENDFRTLLTGNRREKAVVMGGEAFMNSLHKNGASATLELLIRLAAKQDWVVDELIYLFASTLSLSNFLKKIPSFEVTATEFEHWCKSSEFLFGPKRETAALLIEDGEVVKILSKVGKLMAAKKEKKDK